MIQALYVCAEQIVAKHHGGGSVCYNELCALSELEEVEHVDVICSWSDTLRMLLPCRDKIDFYFYPFETANSPDIWAKDKSAYLTYSRMLTKDFKYTKKYWLAHFYSGTYPMLTRALKRDGTKITYTVAAHDIQISYEEHMKLYGSFPYPHLMWGVKEP